MVVEGGIRRTVSGWGWLGLLTLAVAVLPLAPSQARVVAEEKAAAKPANEVSPNTSKPMVEPPKPVAGKNFVVVPFTTELQRALHRSHETATFYVLINVAAMISENDKVLDIGAVDFKSLHDALQGFVRAGLLRRVILTGDTGTRDVSWKPGTASWVLIAWLNNVVPTNDFSSYLQPSLHGRDWNATVAKLSVAPTEEAIRNERGIGDGLVKVYPIQTPLSRCFCGPGEDCVVRIIKRLDQLTPEEIRAFPERAKTYAARLGIKQPFKACLVLNYGTSRVKSNRAENQLHMGDDSWWEAQGFEWIMLTAWNDMRGTLPTLLVKVVGEDGASVKDAKIIVYYPEELKRLEAGVLVKKDGNDRWRVYGLLDGDDFTFTVQAPGYRRASQTLNLSEGVTKELQVKLQKQ